MMVVKVAAVGFLNSPAVFLCHIHVFTGDVKKNLDQVLYGVGFIISGQMKQAYL